MDIDTDIKKVETRYLLCQCNAVLSIDVVTTGGCFYSHTSLKVDDSVVNFFGRNTRRKKRSALYPPTRMYVFCNNCNRKHKVSTFKP
jgi:hypothetical protein